MTDKQRVLKILEQASDKGIHSFDLMKLANTPRVAARVRDLKEEGYDIASEPEKMGDSVGTRYTLVGGVQKPVYKWIIDDVNNKAIRVRI